MQLLGKWHALRLDLEKKLFELTQDKAIFSVRGSYKENIFHGHCLGEGGLNYSRIQGLPTTFERLNEIYT